ncbi:zinc finger HIT domain-containing protein 1-like isoform X5 [Cyprinus carpio]|uniref:Zinc finger HIT domain-containing protein 1-like isoform X5 n=1 Tax=Cyprinus carpio TaxID=7962 RepID=A0A9R0AV31_CYPCA|nr:zinc finger HIT domain-containing protein 1-like isoform X5 [Cyprinus carpio]
MAEKKTTGNLRSQDPNQRRVLDSATRQRRLTRQLEALEKDNFQDDPHASLPQLVKRLPQFDESNESGNESSKRRKKTRGDHFKQRFRKNFQALLEEEVTHATHSNCVLRNIQRETLTLFLGLECQ